jgi:hypothetical protein
MTCPVCNGPQMVDHPAGLLAIRHDRVCNLRDQEDATQAADHDRLRRNGVWRLKRNMTSAEYTLLAAAGFTVSPEPQTVVTIVTPSVLHRAFDAELEEAS